MVRKIDGLVKAKPDIILITGDTFHKSPRNSSLFLRFCSIRSIKSTANLGANSTKLFLPEPLAWHVKNHKKLDNSFWVDY